MYKRNKYVLMFSMGISVLSCVFIKNKYLMLIIAVILFSTALEKKSKKIEILALLLTVFNIFCGKLMFFCKILLFFDIYLWITRYLSKKDLLIIYSNCSKNSVFRKIVLFFIFFPKLYLKNYNRFDYYFKSKNVVSDLKKIFDQTKDDYRSVLIEFQRRLFFNKKVTFDGYINTYDIVTFFFTLFIFCFSTVL